MTKPKSDEPEAVSRLVPDADKDAFDALLRRAVLDEASPPEGEVRRSPCVVAEVELGEEWCFPDTWTCVARMLRFSQ